MHYLEQSVPAYSVTKIITIIKSIIVREMFRTHPEVKKQLWGGEFWSDGYFVNTVGRFGDKSTISQYVRAQCIVHEYKQLHKSERLSLF